VELVGRSNIAQKLLPQHFISLLLLDLGSRLGGRSSNILGGSGLNDTDSDGLSHVSDSKTSKRGEVRESFDTHGLAGDEPDDSSISGLDELGIVLSGLTSTPVNLLLDLSELASNVSGVTIQDWRVSVGDLSRVVQNNNLSSEVLNSSSWTVL